MRLDIIFLNSNTYETVLGFGETQIGVYTGRISEEIQSQRRRIEMGFSFGIYMETSIDRYVKDDFDVRRADWEERFRKLQEFSDCSRIYIRKLEDMGLTIREGKDYLRKELQKDQEILLYGNVQPVCSQLVGPGKTVLEISCGPGNATVMLVETIRALGGSFSAIDLSESMIAFTRQRLRDIGYGREAEYIFQSVATELTWHPDFRPHQLFPEGSQDLVVFGRVGNHLLSDNEWKAALREIGSVLKEGGHVVVYESTKDLNPDRMVDPSSSRFRTRSLYRNTFKKIQLIERKELYRECALAGDRYAIMAFQKCS